MKKRRLVILAREGASTNILYHSLKNDYEIVAIILENSVPAIQFLKKRIKKLGFWKVFGQVLFQVTIAKILNFTSLKRKKEILESYGLTEHALPSEKLIKINSVNDPKCILFLKKVQPDLVIVNGTRIIAQEILSCIPVKFINIHAGITPKYRNVHGGYWALVNKDWDNCGVTVHYVDAGIDTGNILYQKNIIVTSKDNFATYPFLQLAEGIIFLKKGLIDIFSDKVILKKNSAESKIWYHPTLWQYLYFRIFHGIK